MALLSDDTAILANPYQIDKSNNCNDMSTGRSLPEMENKNEG